MTDPQQPDPEPPAPPDAADRDVDLPMDDEDEADERIVPGNEDVETGAGAIEPPD
jgi:hypothetical protein